MTFNYFKGTDKFHKGILNEESLSSWITTVGTVTPTESFDTCQKLIESGLEKCEMEIKVNGVCLNVERILDRLCEEIRRI